MSDLSDSTSSTTEPPRFCSGCGSPLFPDSAFCSECGAPVSEVVNDLPLAAVTDAKFSPTPVRTAKTPSTKVVAIVGGIVLLLLLVVAGNLVYLRLTGNKVAMDDRKFPVTFSNESQSQNSTPAQLVYLHMIGEFRRGSGDTLMAGSPQISDRQVDIRLKFENTWENWRFVETENDGERATVAVGLADAGAYEYYVLEKKRGKWTIAGTLGSDGF